MAAVINLILEIVLTLVLLVIICFLVVGTIVLIWWRFKVRKIRKNIPEGMDGLIEKEKLKMQEVENEKSKREKAREVSRGETEGRERVVEKPAGDTGTEEYVEEQRGVQIPEIAKAGKAKRVVKLHKPTAL